MLTFKGDFAVQILRTSEKDLFGIFTVPDGLVIQISLRTIVHAPPQKKTSWEVRTFLKFAKPVGRRNLNKAWGYTKQGYRISDEGRKCIVMINVTLIHVVYR